MVAPSVYFSLYGRGQTNDHHVVVRRLAGAGAPTVKYVAGHLADIMAVPSSTDWVMGGDSTQAYMSASALLDVDTVPPDQGDIYDFGIAPQDGAGLALPLADGRFVMCQSTRVYIVEPTTPAPAAYFSVFGLGSPVNQNVVAIALQGATVRVLYASRGNGTQIARVLTFSLDAVPTGTVDLSSGPIYTGSVPWPFDEVDNYNWHTGLIPHVLGSFDYCLHRYADRSGDGQKALGVAVFLGAPFADGGQMKVSGYQAAWRSLPPTTAAFDQFTHGSSMTGNNLVSQSQTSSQLTVISDTVAAAGLSEDDYYFDFTFATLALGFEVPVVPLFWTNLRSAVEIA